MTTRERIEDLLCQRGIFERQAKAIMDYAIPLIDLDMAESGMSKITWNRPSEEYPTVFYAALMLTQINKRVVEWADQNLPMAWWKPMFM